VTGGWRLIDDVLGTFELIDEDPRTRARLPRIDGLCAAPDCNEPFWRSRTSHGGGGWNPGED